MNEGNEVCTTSTICCQCACKTNAVKVVWPPVGRCSWKSLWAQRTSFLLYIIFIWFLFQITYIGSGRTSKLDSLGSFSDLPVRLQPIQFTPTENLEMSEKRVIYSSYLFNDILEAREEIKPIPVYVLANIESDRFKMWMKSRTYEHIAPIIELRVQPTYDMNTTKRLYPTIVERVIESAIEKKVLISDNTVKIISASVGHLKMIKHAYDQGHNLAFFFEDDGYIIPHNLQTYSHMDIIHELDRDYPRWSRIQFINGFVSDWLKSMRERYRDGRKRFERRHTTGAVGYGLSRRALEYIASKYFDDSGEVFFGDDYECRQFKFLTAIDDCILYDLEENYVATPQMGVHRSVSSPDQPALHSATMNDAATEGMMLWWVQEFMEKLYGIKMTNEIE